MVINKDKSGIVIFGNRKSCSIPFMKNQVKEDGNTSDKGKKKSQWTPTMSTFKGIPICTKYKYLGTWFDSKLSCGPQIGHIKKKASLIYIKPYSYLKSASAEARRDM